MPSPAPSHDRQEASTRDGDEAEKSVYIVCKTDDGTSPRSAAAVET
jgi:hypothetical protein